MGSSFVSFNGSGYWSRDAALEVWLCLLANKIDEQSAAEP
jgi:hypothetical protein